MSLDHLKAHEVFNVIRTNIAAVPLLNTFKVVSEQTRQHKTPIPTNQYDMFLESEAYNRKIQIRIEDYHKNQKLLLWIDKLDNSNLNRLNLEYFFFDSLNIKNVKQRVKFKATSPEELNEKVKGILNFYTQNADEKLAQIIRGMDWLDQPFDWGTYK